jgi:beta-N-acetylhexosaminidase
MRLRSRFFSAWLLLVLLFALPGSSSGSQASPANQEDVARQKAKTMLLKLTPEEKVGQLFLITLSGTTFDEKSQIYDLITRHHIGGVILTRANDNISWGADSLKQLSQLTNEVQQSEWESAQLVVSNQNGIGFSPQYIPMLIGISQEGNSYPNDQLLQGVTSLPSLMSVGATWNPLMAEQVGAVMGKELAALGFNLYLGPSLDVVDNQQVNGADDLGVRAFGGDPYWVGKMGRAYIAGLHEGSANQMVVIAKHFPGRGGSDRPLDDEIPTVRKPLEQLKQVELAPFFSVTQNTLDPNMVVDGLLVSHIRYQGFQGNIRATTRPVSSDSAALELILGQQPLTEWRSNGGLLVSDNLGSQAIRRFYDPSGNSFDARTAAREAFIAGNDLLYLDHFIASNDPDSYTTIIRTLEFFAQKYREDEAFAQRVDASVERILTIKYRIYPAFDFNSIIPAEDKLNEVGKSQAVTFDIARRSVTLISPSIAELPNVLPRPPELRDRIVFLTDVQTVRPCSSCSDYVPLGVDALQSAVTRLYGPRAGGLVNQSLMISYPYSDLAKYLNGSTEVEPLEKDLQMADWVVVSMIRPNSAEPDTLAFKRLLSERPGLLRNKKVIVFAFNAPYYLDATDISKLTAYYGLYSETPEFVEVAARILFNEQAATGALPVSVPGIGFDLTQATSPDPTHVIPLTIDFPDTAGRATRSTQEPTPSPIFEVGDILQLRTGIIEDYNSNPVPDGTPVRFLFNVISQDNPTQMQIDTATTDGVARATYRIERSGVLEIYATSGSQGARSNLLRLDTVSGGVTVVPPTSQPTETPTPTPTPTVTVTITVTPTPVPPATVHVADWFYVLIIIIGSAAGISLWGMRLAIARWGLRWALCGVIGGLLAYNYLALSLPGSQTVLRENGTSGTLLVTLGGVILGWGFGFVWRQIGRSGGRSTSDRLGRNSSQERPATGPKSQSS